MPSKLEQIDAEIAQLEGQIATSMQGGEGGAAPDYSAFFKSPGYEFRFDEGVRARDRSASARGTLLGGGYGRELTRYGQGFATGEFTNYANRLAALAGMGQGSTTATATLGAQTGANIGNTLMSGARGQGAAIMAAGTARASGYAGAANAITGGAQNWMLYNMLQGRTER